MDAKRTEYRWFEQMGLRPTAVSGSADRLREPARRVATVLLLVLVLLGPIMTFGGMNLSDEGTVERQIGYLFVAGLAVYASWPVSTRFSMVAVPAAVVAAFAWCWLSLTWAVDPGASFRRLVLTTTVAWTVFLLVRHTSYRSLIDVLRWSLVAAIAVSYVVAILDPSVGTHTMADSAMPTALEGNWRGILGHKNFAGAVCALCILLFVFDAKHLRGALRIGVIVAAAYFLFRSQSKTSAGMLGVALLCGFLFEQVNRRLRAFLLPIITVATAVFGVLFSAYADFLKTNFFDPTAFTGRGQIWSVLLRYSKDHPMFGAGFGSFWNIGSESPVFVYGQGYVTLITVGHSGYLDQLVAVGIPGVLLMVFAVIGWPMWKLLSRTDLAPERGALFAAMLLFCLGHNITESGLFERDAIVSTFLFFTIALVQHAQPDTPQKRSRAREDSGDELLRLMRRERQPAPTGEA